MPARQNAFVPARVLPDTPPPGLVGPATVPVGMPTPPPGVGWLVLYASKRTANNAVHPVLLVDGRPSQIDWGVVLVPLAPGPHRVRVAVDMLGGVGFAEIDLLVEAGAQTSLYYRAPLRVTRPGAFTPTFELHPDERQMQICWCLAIVVAVLSLALLIVLASGGNLGGGGGGGYGPVVVHGLGGRIP